MDCSRLCFRDDEFVFCFFDKEYIVNCLKVSFCESPYINIYLCAASENCKNIQNSSSVWWVFYSLWCLPMFLFIVVTFWMVIIFICCCTPPLFIILLSLPFLNPDPVSFSIFETFESKKDIEKPDPSKVNTFL
jgi:hypothetical protein